MDSLPTAAQVISGVGSSVSAAAASAATSAADAKVASNLASAAGLGDAQYFEESISPSAVRTQLSGADPSNAGSAPAMLRGMKWLLACMSKGRDVSDFFPHVVKLVGAPSLEVRKMVYLYLVRYSDHDPTCRELALLSINSFQRGLADGEPLIRALALRVLSSVEVRDVLQIQILAVRRCAADSSPYVRKCAANALAKLGPRCVGGPQSVSHREELVEVAAKLLEEDASTMVLTSAAVAFVELCPDRLELLHPCYRKICHLLTDMDEWGQVVVLDVLSRYCRRYFREPSARGAGGSAEAVDRERRVRRTVRGIAGRPHAGTAGAAAGGGGGGADVGAALDELLPPAKGEKGGARPPERTGPRKVKRRVVKKAFYSDEEDESEYEDVVYGNDRGGGGGGGGPVRRDVMGFGGGGGVTGPAAAVGSAAGLLTPGADSEDADLDDDHRLLLRSSLPLLKSRNSAVVLAVASLQYYCGVASVAVRSAVGKALVRIYRGRREVQYVVLTCIKRLVRDCPSAFAPFLEDFFVKAMDPSFTRLAKLDILTSLTLDPPSIKSVLTELRTYIRHDDAEFVRASIRAVGKVAELARIVHDRRGLKTGDAASARGDADDVALNCLHGLLGVAEGSTDEGTVGECVLVSERILLMLRSDRVRGGGGGGSGGGEAAPVRDPNGVRGAALRRLVLLLVRALATKGPEGEEAEEEEGEEGGGAEGAADGGGDERLAALKERTVTLPPSAVAPALWIAGEWMCSPGGGGAAAELDGTTEKETAHMRSELIRLVARAFPGLDPAEKLQAVHLASKALLVSQEGRERHRHRAEDDASLSELVLSMGRSDADADVRDRARFESRVLHAALEGGLKFDADGLPPAPVAFGAERARRILRCSKPPPSYLPVDETGDPDSTAGEDASSFRFGTLSSLVSGRAGRAYLPLPPWAERDSPSTLRDPAAAAAPVSPESGPQRGDGWNVQQKQEGGAEGFYDSDEESSTSSSSSSEDTSSTSSSEESESSSEDSFSNDESSSEEESESSSEEEESDDEEGEEEAAPRATSGGMGASDLEALMNGGGAGAMKSTAPAAPMRAEEVESDSGDEASSESSSSSSEDGDDSVESSEGAPAAAAGGANIGSLLPMGAAAAPAAPPAPPAAKPPVIEKQVSSASSVADDLQGLVMAPLVVDNDDISGSVGEADEEHESSIWTVLVRPELGGGLLAKSRYLRGKTLQREARTLGLDPDTSTVVCLRVKFENKRTDTGVLRRIRVVQRGGSGGSGTIAPSRFIVPPEIGALKKGQSASIVLGLSYLKSSDRDGSLLSKFEVKSDRGSFQVEIRPPLGELLHPCRMKKNAFDSEMEKLHGMYQRTTSAFSLSSDGTTTASMKESWEGLPSRIVKHVNLTPVGQLGWRHDSTCALAGKLPVSGSIVCVVVSCSSETGSGDFMVCCDDTMAVNGVMDLLKRAISNDDTVQQ